MLSLKQPPHCEWGMRSERRGKLHVGNHAETNECVRIREIEIHTAVLLVNEEHSTSKQDYNRMADEENEKAGEIGRAEDDGKIEYLERTAKSFFFSLYCFCPSGVSPGVSGCSYQSFKLFSADSPSLTHTVRWTG